TTLLRMPICRSTVTKQEPHRSHAAQELLARRSRCTIRVRWPTVRPYADTSGVTCAAKRRRWPGRPYAAHPYAAQEESGHAWEKEGSHRRRRTPGRRLDHAGAGRGGLRHRRGHSGPALLRHGARTQARPDPARPADALSGGRGRVAAAADES